MRHRTLYGGFVLAAVALVSCSEGPTEVPSEQAPTADVISAAVAGSGATNPVDVFEPVSTVRMRKGLGINASADWEIRMAKDMGATEVRMSWMWDQVEKTPGQFALTDTYEAQLALVKSLGLNPLIVAAYGPEWLPLDSLTVAKPAAVGATEIFVKSTTYYSKFKVRFDHILRGDGSHTGDQLTGKWSYPGTPVASVSSSRGSITLSAPLKKALNTGDRLAVNRRFYGITDGTDTDPSLTPYANYARYLASRISGAGLTGRVEIWNESPWSHDAWDAGWGCYSAAVGSFCASPNYAMGHAVLKRTPPSSVRWVWGGTHKSGANSVLGWRFGMDPTRAQVENSMAFEAFHPYPKGSPEEGMWNPACLKAKAPGSDVRTCSLLGSNVNSNFKTARKFAVDNQAAYGWSIKHVISETGIFTNNQSARTRYLLRTYLGYMGLGLQRITYFRLSDSSSGAPGYGWADKQSKAAFPVMGAFKAFMTDLDRYSSEPLGTITPDKLPQVTAYAGQWPLVVVPVVGRVAGKATNSALLAVWQRTYTTTLTGTTQEWENLPRPAASTVTIAIPTGLRYVSARKLTDRTVPTVTQVDSKTLKVAVTDDPVLITFEP